MSLPPCQLSDAKRVYIVFISPSTECGTGVQGEASIGAIATINRCNLSDVRITVRQSLRPTVEQENVATSSSSHRATKRTGESSDGTCTAQHGWRQIPRREGCGRTNCMGEGSGIAFPPD